jgi:AP-1 complex subunit sigma 1/2
MCNFIEWQDKKVIYKRYASLFFVACVDKNDNELIVLEQIHLFVEVLDRYFGNVCELDIIFNFHKAYYILDELFIGGHLQETSKVGDESARCALHSSSKLCDPPGVSHSLLLLRCSLV